METERIAMVKLVESFHREYEQINDNIKMPDGFNQEWNMKMGRLNQIAKENIKAFYDEIEHGEAKMENVVECLMQIHQSFAEWYRMIQDQPDQEDEGEDEDANIYEDVENKDNDDEEEQNWFGVE